MKRREFISAALAAASTSSFAVFEKPDSPVSPKETWMNDPFGAYQPDEFVYIKPHIELLDGGGLCVIWFSREIATGWTEWTQDGGKTWRRSWTSQDGYRDCFETVHRSVLEGADLSKPIKYRTVTRPIKAYGIQMLRYRGMDPMEAKGYERTRRYVDQSRIDYKGVEYIDEGEINPVFQKDGTQATVMFNDLHHGYAKTCTALMPHVADRAVNLAVFAGDIIDHSRSKFDVEQYLAGSLAYVGRELKCACRFVRGNHELMGAYGSQLRYSIAPKGEHPFYGAATLGDLRMVFLDSGAESADGDWGSMDVLDFNRFFAEETDWLDAETSSPEWKKAGKRVAYIHIPPLWGKDLTQYRGDLRRIPMHRLLKERGLDLLMAGHTHNPVFLPPCEGLTSYPMAIGGSPGIKSATVTRCVYSNGALEVDQFKADGTRVFREKIN